MKIWISLLVIYSSFFIWYTDLGGKLSDEEIKSFISQLERNGVQDNIPEDRARVFLSSMTKFMKEDSGKQFFMVNIIDMSDNPTFSDGTSANDSADNLMNKYMEHMYPELFKRASHPVFFSSAVSDAMDVVGIKNAKVWETAVLMRYQSRRSFLEIVANPDLLGEHEYKVAALEKTIAFPAEPELYLGDPRMILGLLLLIIGLVARPMTRK